MRLTVLYWSTFFCTLLSLPCPRFIESTLITNVQSLITVTLSLPYYTSDDFLPSSFSVSWPQQNCFGFRTCFLQGIEDSGIRVGLQHSKLHQSNRREPGPFRKAGFGECGRGDHAIYPSSFPIKSFTFKNQILSQIF